MERFAGLDLKLIRMAATKKELLKWFEENKVSLPPKNERGNITVKALNEARRQHLQKGDDKESSQPSPGEFDQSKLRGMGEEWGVALRYRDPSDPELVALVEAAQKTMNAARVGIKDGSLSKPELEALAHQLYESELFGDRRFSSPAAISKALGQWSKKIDKWKASAKKSEPEPEQPKPEEEETGAKEVPWYEKIIEEEMQNPTRQEVSLEEAYGDPEEQALRQRTLDEAFGQKPKNKKKAPWYKRMFGLSTDLSVERYAGLQRSEIQA